MQLNWNGASWDSLSQKYFEYDLNNNKTEELWMTWWNSSWNNSRRYTNVYDAGNNKTHWHHEEWDGFWFDEAESFYYYGAHHSVIYSLQRERHIFSLVDVGDYHAEYDSANNLLNSQSDHWGNGVSMPHYTSHDYTYDLNGNRISEVNVSLNIDMDFETDSVHHYFRNPYLYNQEHAQLTFSVYPNPSRGNLTVTCLNEIFSIEIYNPLGQKVFFKNNLSGKEQSIQCEFSSGIYFIQVNHNNRTSVQRLMIE